MILPDWVRYIAIGLAILGLILGSAMVVGSQWVGNEVLPPAYRTERVDERLHDSYAIVEFQMLPIPLAATGFALVICSIFGIYGMMLWPRHCKSRPA